ncbi:MAG: winged helix-turn-helix transcriptional regulator [Myxococcota bacterium]
MHRAPSEHLCPAFQAAMDLLGRPWTGRILTALEEGPKRFTELSARVGAIGDRMLACRLKELEAAGVIARHVIPSTPVRVEYELTDAGRGFGDVARSLEAWGRALLAASPEAATAREVHEDACVAEEP